MRRMRFFGAIVLAATFVALPSFAAAAAATPAAAKSPARIVAVNPGLTEIVLELGEGARLVGIDIVTHDPRIAPALPRVGYQRALSAEGILALKPDAVLVTEDAGPPAAIASLRSAGVPLVELSGAPTIEAMKQRIGGIATLLGVTEKGAALLAQLEKDAAAAKQPLAGVKPPPSALFVLSRQGAGMQVAGTETAADALLRLAGASNAAAQFEGYRPLSAEAALAAAPTAIVVTEGTVKAAGGKDAILKAPGLASTPAARAGSVLVVDDAAILGFGPSAIRSALDLAQRMQKLAKSSSR
jgi:iron complex transport system substrate-binding protein